MLQTTSLAFTPVSARFETLVPDSRFSRRRRHSPPHTVIRCHFSLSIGPPPPNYQISNRPRYLEPNCTAHTAPSWSRQHLYNSSRVDTYYPSEQHLILISCTCNFSASLYLLLCSHTCFLLWLLEVDSPPFLLSLSPLIAAAVYSKLHFFIDFRAFRAFGQAQPLLSNLMAESELYNWAAG